MVYAEGKRLYSWYTPVHYTKCMHVYLKHPQNEDSVVIIAASTFHPRQVDQAGKMSRTIADDSVVSKLQMRSRLTNNFNKFIVEYSAKNEAYRGKTLKTFEVADFTVPLIEHFIAYLEDNIKTYNTARVYLSSLYVLLKEKNLTLHVPHTTDWQSKLRKHFTQACHSNRTALINHKMPINAADNHYICQQLFQNGNLEESALQALDWANGGRISEGPGLAWADLKLFDPRPPEEVSKNVWKNFL